MNNLDLSDTHVREQITQLLNITCERLNLMPRMGELKFTMGVEPFDEGQEKRVLDKAIQKAKRLGLPKDLVIRFIQTQMDIAKLIQSQIIEQLTTQGLPKLTDEEIQAAAKEQSTLRSTIGAKMEPLFLALKPLINELSSPIIQREISRQLDNNRYTGECAKPIIREEIKKSFRKAAGQIH
ncbi:chorismate mutase [Sansalvadorimonas sp. 2012CJ34-2]|uniref:chorismate mutase n=1 Tax=Parendozoicomonas callyspongiae TaxID=2942213 RepID=A0ABT0PIM4_9GAMM|nr:chorismate mutase [Sansalvadorimonas sp. 2012CJ34-2]